MLDRLLPAFIAVILLSTLLLVGLETVSLSDHATGWDGYYYLVQVKSLVTEGQMHSPEYSPVYIPLMAFYALTGDYLTAFRFTAVLAELLFVLSVYALTAALAGAAGEGRLSARSAGVLAAAVSMMSPSLNFFLTQFPKNLLGFAMFMFFAAMTVRTRRSLRRGGRGFLYVTLSLAACLLLFVAAFLTHRFSAVLSLVFLAVCFAPGLFGALTQVLKGKGSPGGRRLLLAAVAMLVLGVVLLATGSLPLAPSVHDLARITGDLSAGPVLVPLEFIRAFGSFRLTVPWVAEIVMASVIPLLAAVLLLRRKTAGREGLGSGYLAVLALSLAGLFPFLRFTLTGAAYRLLFATLLLFPVVCLPWTVMAGRWISGRGQHGMRLLAAAAALLAGLSMVTAPSYRPEMHDPPYGYYEDLSDLIMEELSDRDFELIVAHRSLAEVITFRHGADALPWAPEERFHRQRVWRVTAGIMRDEFLYYLGSHVCDSFHVRLRGDYGLLREDLWETFLDSIAGDPVMMEAVNTWRNPMERRPRYLARNVRD